MAKLHKTEITAVAEQIAENILKKNTQYNEELSKVEYAKWFKIYQKTDTYKNLKKFCKDSEEFSVLTENFKYVSRISKYILEDILEDIFRKNSIFKYKSTSIPLNSIKRDIIIKQVQEIDIKDLMEELTKKYSH